jgi:hypothetical protein
MVDVLTGSGLSQTGRSTAPDPSLDRVSVGGSGNFSTPNSVVFEFGTVNQQQKFGTPRTVYVDNGTGPNPILVHVSITEQTFTVPPFAQGYFPITATEVSRITFSGDGGNTDPVNIQIYNYLIPPQVWYAPGQNNPIAANAIQGAMAEGSSVAASTSNAPVYVGGVDRGTGLFHGVAVDAQGNLQVEFTTSQSVAATIADGADITQGALDDAAWSGIAGPASVVAILKAVWNNITSMSAKLPATLGIKTIPNSLSVVPATDAVIAMLPVNSSSLSNITNAGWFPATITGQHLYFETRPFSYNGSTFDLLQNNTNTSALITATGATTSQTSADQTNYNGRGIQVVLDMTVVGTGSVTITIEGKDAASGKYYPLLVGLPVVTNSTNVYTVYPGAAATANVSSPSPLPRTWRVRTTANNANAATYTVGACVIV